jgi:hypothetical protein
MFPINELMGIVALSNAELRSLSNAKRILSIDRRSNDTIFKGISPFIQRAGEIKTYDQLSTKPIFSFCYNDVD